MLIYHPAFDLYNCVFRMLRLITFMKQEHVELDRLRIWDFYLTFPNEARKIKFPQDLQELKKIFKQQEVNPYDDLIDPRRIIERMKSYQISALKCIVSYGLIDSNDFSKNIIRRTEKEIPKEILDKFRQTTDEEENILDMQSVCMMQV